MGIRESGLGQPLLIQYPISVSECVSNLNLGNIGNSVMKKKQGEMCFYLLDGLCANWGINNELICNYWGNLGYQRHVGGNYI